jgi:hypothetical protein
MGGFDDYALGVGLEDRYLMQRAMCGDMVLALSPATVGGTAGAAGASSRSVEITLKTADGELHKWMNADFATKLSIADTSTPVPSLASTTLQLRGGKATVVITLPAGTYNAGETNTLTLANLTIMGYTVTGGTSVQTFA